MIFFLFCVLFFSVSVSSAMKTTPSSIQIQESQHTRRWGNKSREEEEQKKEKKETLSSSSSLHFKNNGTNGFSSLLCSQLRSLHLSPFPPSTK